MGGGFKVCKYSCACDHVVGGKKVRWGVGRVRKEKRCPDSSGWWTKCNVLGIPCMV